MKECWNCTYKEEVPGSAHIKCMFDWSKSKNKMPECDSEHGRQWFSFPYNFDPCWGDECKECSTKINISKERKETPMDKIMLLLG